MNVATEKLVDMELQVTESSKAAEEGLMWLSETSKGAELLEGEVQVLKTQLSKMVKAREQVVEDSESRQWQVRALKTRAHMLGDKLDSLKCRESTNFKVEVKIRKVIETQSDITDLVTGLHCKAVRSYDFFSRGVDGALVEVSRYLKEAFARKTQNLQQIVRDTVRRAVEEIQGSFVDASGLIDKWLGVIVGRATYTDV